WDRPGGKIEQGAIEGEVTYRQLLRTSVMESDINSCSGRGAVLVEKATEWIERSGRICVQQGIAQPGLARFANGEVLAFVTRVTETHFPAPRLEVIGNPSHLTT